MLALLVGCASEAPRAISEAPASNISLTQARKDPQAVRGTVVRWGGAIVSVQNRREETWIEIVERPLWPDGQPRDTDRSEGRFLAHVAGFLDPAVYAKNRLITVAGALDEPETHSIDEFPYRYPVVRVTDVYLWPKEPEVYRHYYSPYWYDPWYPWGYPYYPYYHYPSYYVPPRYPYAVPQRH